MTRPISRSAVSRRLADASENGLLPAISSLSYTQNASTDDPSNLHRLSLIHRVSDTLPETERTNQYTVAALTRHKQEGLELAVRARWLALVSIAILLPFLNPQIEILFTYFLMSLIGLNGWVLRVLVVWDIRNPN